MNVDELQKGDVLICKTEDVPCLNYGHEYTVDEEVGGGLFVCCSHKGKKTNHYLIHGMAERHFRWKKEYYNG